MNLFPSSKYFVQLSSRLRIGSLSFAACTSRIIIFSAASSLPSFPALLATPLRFLTFRGPFNVFFSLLLCLLSSVAAEAPLKEENGRAAALFGSRARSSRANGRKEISEIKRADIAALVFRGVAHPFAAFTESCIICD